jgi:hypothetical protein
LITIGINIQLGFAQEANKTSSNTTDETKEPENIYTTIIPVATGLLGVFGSLFGVYISNAFNLRKEELQRNVNSIQDKLNVFSFFIFSLEKMINSEFNDYMKLGEDIDSTIKSKFFLLNPTAIRQWTRVRSTIIYYSTTGPDHKKPVISENRLHELDMDVHRLWDSLVDQYNEQLIPMYEKTVTKPNKYKGDNVKIIERIPSEILAVSVTPVTDKKQNQRIKHQESDETEEAEDYKIKTKIEIIVSEEISRNKLVPNALIAGSLIDSSSKIISKILEYTDENGNVLLNKDLQTGHYKIVGDIASHGYRLLKFERRFEIK